MAAENCAIEPGDTVAVLVAARSGSSPLETLECWAQSEYRHRPYCRTAASGGRKKRHGNNRLKEKLFDVLSEITGGRCISKVPGLIVNPCVLP